MKLITSIEILLFLLLLLFRTSVAQSDIAISDDAYSDFICVIQRISTAKTDPNNLILDLYKKVFIGERFTVERKTGIMAGTLKNSYATKPQIIDSGSKDNSFKVITTMRLQEGAGAGSQIYALTINEYDNSPKKPFVFLDNDVAFFGSCEHF
jgi:hypothetical protein